MNAYMHIIFVTFINQKITNAVNAVIFSGILCGALDVCIHDVYEKNVRTVFT